MKKLILLMAVVLASKAFGAGIKTWSSSSSTNWNSSGNWSPPGVPGSADTVRFNSGNVNCVLPFPVTVAGFIMTPSYFGQFDFGSANTITVTTGDADFRSSGTVVKGTSTRIIFTGSGSQGLYPHPGSALPVVQQNGSGTTTILGGWPLVCDGLMMTSGTFHLGVAQVHTVTDFTSSGGTLDFGSATLQITNTADFLNLGTLTPNAGYLEFTKASGIQILSPKAGATYPPIRHTTPSTLRLQTNNLTTQSFFQRQGTLDFNGRNVTTVGDFASMTTVNTGSWTLNVGGDAMITGRPGALVDVNGTLNVTGRLTADYANVAFCTASGTPGVATRGTNGGFNSGWSFSAANTMYWNPAPWSPNLTDFNRASNWSSNADGTGFQPPATDDDFTANTLNGSWTFKDVPGAGTNSVTYDANEPDVLVLTGKGTGLWGTINSFTSVYRSDITGDFDVSVKVISVKSASTAAEGGIMVADDPNNLSYGGFCAVKATSAGRSSTAT